ncbi:hypothetical protein ACFYPA_34795 [Streptomyces sp. NPDC005775]|uniref:hypothetical protein n=1 Tax=Streptomyces sp. NPDC005775 TaxID=3364729 RepID=UPI003698F371
MKFSDPPAAHPYIPLHQSPHTGVHCWAPTPFCAAPRGVDRIVEVALSDNAGLGNAVIVAYATRTDRTEIPSWPLLFNNVTLRLLGSTTSPPRPSARPARDLTSAAAIGALTVAVGDRHPLDDIAKAHDHVDARGGHGSTLVIIPQ